MKDVLLEVKNIHKSFGSNAVHQGISFDLKRGESLGLLGSSGTGKSVLLRSLIGLEYIDQGEILFHGLNISDYTEQQLYSIRTKISYSFQSGALFDSLSVYENLAFPLNEHTNLTSSVIQEKISHILDLVGLHGKETVMPSDLSGGMQKRVGMARSMMLDPEIILYDEPTAGLDPTNTKKIVSIMKKFKDLGQASIFVTHDIPSALDLCDRIIVLNKGKIIFNDTPEAILKSDNEFIKNFINPEDIE